MSPESTTLRALVTARLAAAAEDIFELFERTILEYEEELCRCNEKRRQEEAHHEERRQEEARDVSQMFGLNQQTLCTPQTPQVKEEQEEPGLKQEEKLPQVLFPKCQVKLEYIRIDPQIQSVDEEDLKLEAVGELEPEAEGDREPPPTDTTEDRSAPMSAQERSINTAHTSGEKPRKHQCDICQKRFVRKDCLRMHIRTHSKEKPHRCPICSKAFTLRSTLTVHLKTHMGSKPFSCPTCRRCFAQANYLKLHIRTHTGERPYSCTLCDQRFAQSFTLTKHMRRHIGDKPYRCSTCGKGFVTSYCLTRHMGSHARKQLNALRKHLQDQDPSESAHIGEAMRQLNAQ